MRLAVASEAEKRQRDRVTYAAWGERLTPADFELREERLRAHPWAHEAMLTWILFDGRDQKVASCETFRMESLARGERGACYGVASVFVEEHLRGQGHALQMMQLLSLELQARDPAAHAAILFSDVGTALYERAGYVVRPAADLIFPPTGDTAMGVDLLSDDDVPAVMRAAALPAPHDDFVVWPTPAQLDWHRERERVYAERLGRPYLPIAGAARGPAVLLWAADLKHERLYILYLNAKAQDDVVALVRAARALAGRSGLREVRLWEFPQPSWPFAKEGGVRELRTESLPMIRPFSRTERSRVAAHAWNWIPRGIWV